LEAPTPKPKAESGAVAEAAAVATMEAAVDSKGTTLDEALVEVALEGTKSDRQDSAGVVAPTRRGARNPSRNAKEIETTTTASHRKLPSVAGRALSCKLAAKLPTVKLGVAPKAITTITKTSSGVVLPQLTAM